MYSEVLTSSMGWKLPYDYQLWIDSDIVFNTEKFWQLLDMALPEEAVTSEPIYEDVKDEKEK